MNYEYVSMIVCTLTKTSCRLTTIWKSIGEQIKE